MRTCEIISEGVACANEAVFEIRTPWSSQFACESCTRPIRRRYEVTPIGALVVKEAPKSRVVQDANGNVRLFCHCGAVGRFRPGVDNRPLCDEHYAPSQSSINSNKTSTSTLRDAIIDVIDSALTFVQQKLNNLRRKP